MAVRHHDRLPLPVRPPDDLAVPLSRPDCETAWVRTGEGEVPQGDQVLGQALPDQHRHGRRHRHRAGVPVRHELVRLLALRRRRLRRAARLRGADRLLLRVHLHRPVDLRLGQAAQEDPPGLHLDGLDRHARCRRTSSSRPTPGCSTRSATGSTRRSGRAELDRHLARCSPRTPRSARSSTAISARLPDRRAPSWSASPPCTWRARSTSR